MIDLSSMAQPRAAPVRRVGGMTSTPPIPLPDDPATLKAMVRDLVRAREEDAAARVALARRVDDLPLKSLRLEMELLKYKKWVYGPRTDRLTTIEQVNQMLLGFGADLDQRPVHPLHPADAAAVMGVGAEDTARDAVPSRRVKRAGWTTHSRRRRLRRPPRHPLRARPPRGGQALPLLRGHAGEDREESSWQFEYIPGHFERLEHVQFIYACAACEKTASPHGPQIERAEKPVGMIDKGLAGPGLLAFIVTSKFSEYTPPTGWRTSSPGLASHSPAPP